MWWRRPRVVATTRADASPTGGVGRVAREQSSAVVALQEADKRLGPRPTALSPEAIRATGMHALEINSTHLTPVN